MCLIKFSQLEPLGRLIVVLRLLSTTTIATFLSSLPLLLLPSRIILRHLLHLAKELRALHLVALAALLLSLVITLLVLVLCLMGRVLLKHLLGLESVVHGHTLGALLLLISDLLVL